MNDEPRISKLANCPNCDLAVLAENIHHCPDCEAEVCRYCIGLHTAQFHNDDNPDNTKGDNNAEKTDR